MLELFKNPKVVAALATILTAVGVHLGFEVSEELVGGVLLVVLGYIFKSEVKTAATAVKNKVTGPKE